MKQKKLSNKAVIFLCTLAISGLFGVAALLDAMQSENPRHIIEGDNKIFCEELYYGVTSDDTKFQICLPKEKTSFRDSIVLLNGKRTNTLNGARLRDGGTTTIYTEAGNFFFPDPDYDPRMPWENGPKPEVKASFNDKPLLEWHKK